MYKTVTIEDDVRVPPEQLRGSPEENVAATLRTSIEGTANKEFGVLLAVLDVENVGDGSIEPGDGGVHYPTTYRALAYKPELHEIVRGEISDITEFGAFIRIGPLEALCHVSQLMDEYVSFDEENEQFVSNEDNRILQVGDTVFARVTAISFGQNRVNKINLTMRQNGLGKAEWLEQKLEEAENQADGEE